MRNFNMNLKQLLDAYELTYTQEFEIVKLQNIDLDKVTKQQLLDTLVDTAKLLLIKENIIKELFKQNA